MARPAAYLRDIHWVHREPPLGTQIDVQTRYREKSVPATIMHEGNNVAAVFKEPHEASPGQSLVIYQGDRCLGGGVIQKESPSVRTGVAVQTTNAQQNTQIVHMRPVKTIVRPFGQLPSGLPRSTLGRRVQ